MTTYESAVGAVADALHEECVREWRAIGVADPGRMVTQHAADAHYGRAHDVVRRLHAAAILELDEEEDLESAIDAVAELTPNVDRAIVRSVVESTHRKASWRRSG